MGEEYGIRERILAAALEAASLFGLNKLSMADVANRAELSRQTLYRHFPSKEALVNEVVVGETVKLVETVLDVEAMNDETNPGEGLRQGFLAALNAAREHPLLDRLIRTEPESLLPLLVTDGGPVMRKVREVVEQTVAKDLPLVDDLTRRRVADVMTRLLISYAVSAPDDPPELVATFLADVLVSGLTAMLLPANGQTQKGSVPWLQ